MDILDSGHTGNQLRLKHKLVEENRSNLATVLKLADQSTKMENRHGRPEVRKSPSHSLLEQLQVEQGNLQRLEHTLV